MSAELIEALRVAQEDACILIQDHYSGLPEHREPVMAAVARLAYLFEDGDAEQPRSLDEIVSVGLAARNTLADEQAALAVPTTERPIPEIVQRYRGITWF